MDAKFPLTSSNSSLKEELAQLQIYQFEKCTQTFMNQVELEEHNLSAHEKRSVNSDLKVKISILERQVSEQKLTAAKSIFQLKIKEFKDTQFCSCRSYCRITHQKHNY